MISAPRIPVVRRVRARYAGRMPEYREFLPKKQVDNIGGPVEEHLELERESSGNLPQQPKGLEVDALDGNKIPWSGLRSR